MKDSEAQIVGRPANNGEIETPFAEDGLCLGFLLRLQHHEHPLLAFGEHHLVGAHGFFAHGHAVEIEFDAEITLGAHLDRRTGQSGRAHVLDGDDRSRRHQFEAGLEKAFFGERVANLDRRALLLDLVVKFRRGHGRAANPVAACLGAQIDDWQTDAFCLGIEYLVGFSEAGRERIDEAVAVVARIELNLAAHGGYAEGVAVAADAGNDASHEMAGLGMVRLTKTQRVHGSDRPRTHGEDIPQDATDPGRRALIGLDIGRVVVALHLEYDGQSVANVHHTCVFTRTLNDPGTRGREGAQPFLRGFVGTVLVPHRREDAEFGERRFAPDQIEDTLILVRLQPVCRNQIICDGDVGNAHGHRSLRKDVGVLPRMFKRGKRKRGRG